MNNKNVYSLNNTFEGKIWVDWKGKDGKMGQEISCREKPNISTLRKSPRIGTCVRVRGILNVNGTGTRVHSCKRLRPCAVSQISGCSRPQIIHTSMEMAAFSGMSTQVCVFEGIVYVDWKHRIGSDISRCLKKNIGHRIGRQNWHRLILRNDPEWSWFLTVFYGLQNLFKINSKICFIRFGQDKTYLRDTVFNQGIF